MHGWSLDTTSDETVTATTMLPDSWDTFAVDLYWSNVSTGAGGVRWDVNYESLATGAAPGAGTTVSATSTASTTAGLVVVERMTAVAATVVGRLLRVRVNRDADHAGDTMANDASFHGLLLTRILK